MAEEIGKMGGVVKKWVRRFGGGARIDVETEKKRVGIYPSPPA